MKEILATIIIPIYKSEDYLESCVNSVIAQTEKNIEIILVDDGSPDRCPVLCDALKEKDMRIHVIHKENGGPGPARNAGLDAACGRYVFFLDSDDEMEPECVKQCCQVMERTHADICRFGLHVIESDGHEKYWHCYHSGSFLISENNRLKFLCREQLTYKIGWEACTAAFRRAVIEKSSIRFADVSFAEDMDFTFRFMTVATSMEILPKPYYIYKIRANSIMTGTGDQKQIDQLLRIFILQRQLIDNPEVIEKFEICEAVMITRYIGMWENRHTRRRLFRERILHFSDSGKIIQDIDRMVEMKRDFENTCGKGYGNYVYALMLYLKTGDENRFLQADSRYYSRFRKTCMSLMRKKEDFISMFHKLH